MNGCSWLLHAHNCGEAFKAASYRVAIPRSSVSFRPQWKSSIHRDPAARQPRYVAATAFGAILVI